MKLLYRLFLLIAVILSHIMCGVVAYNYCDMEWKIKVAGIVHQQVLLIYMPFLL